MSVKITLQSPVPIRENHRKFHGFKWIWDGTKRYFVDNRRCFSLRLGPSYFNTISNFVRDILLERYDLRVVNYLDDSFARGVFLFRR